MMQLIANSTGNALPLRVLATISMRRFGTAQGMDIGCGVSGSVEGVVGKEGRYVLTKVPMASDRAIPNILSA
jgi:hypothetical protein